MYISLNVEVDDELDLDQGIVYTTDVALITVRNDGFMGSVSDASYVDAQ